MRPAYARFRLAPIVALLPLAAACGSDGGTRAGRPDRAAVAEARSSFCTVLTETDPFGDATHEELEEHAASLRTAGDELEQVGDIEFAEVARGLARGMEAAREVTELRAWLNDRVRGREVAELRGSLDRITGVTEVEFYSQEEAREEFMRLYGDDPKILEQIAGLGQDTLPASFRIVVDTPDRLSGIRRQVEARAEIDDVASPTGIGLANLDEKKIQEVVRVCVFGQTRETPEPPGSTEARIRYEVRLRDGGSVEATIRYRSPSGELQLDRVRTPWRSEPMTFADGDRLFIRAETEEVVGSPLLCVLASQEEEEGAYVFAKLGRPLSFCATEYDLGLWPPDDDDPIGNPLIRVG